jgi:hypothetical protein
MRVRGDSGVNTIAPASLRMRCGRDQPTKQLWLSLYVLFLFCVTHTTCISSHYFYSVWRIYLYIILSYIIYSVWRIHLYFLSVYYFYSAMHTRLYFCIYCLCIIPILCDANQPNSTNQPTNQPTNRIFQTREVEGADTI